MQTRVSLRERSRRFSSLDRDVLVACAVFGLMRLWAVIGTPPVRFPDSASYAYVNLFGHATGGRLWTVPALYALVQGDSHRVVAQAFIAILCWSALAFAVAHSVANRWLARAGAILVLLLGLCAQVTEWDKAMLSESASLSLEALLIATILWLRLRRTGRVAAIVLVVTTLWIFARQLQVIVFLPIAGVLILWVLIRARRHILIALGLAVIGVWSGYASTQDKLHLDYDAHDIIEYRILPSSGGREFIARAGMPDLPQMEKEAATGVYVGGTNSVVYNDPVWRKWVHEHFPRTFVSWVVHHPWWTIRLPLLDIPTALDGNPQYTTPRATLPSPVADVLWERGEGSFPLWFGFTAAVWFASLTRGRPRGLEWLAIAGFGIGVCWYYAAWHLSGSEVPRLSIPAAAFLRVSCLLIVLGALDRSIQWSNARLVSH